jgi:uncharacterized protein YqgC (DUF456 family)
VSDIGLFLVAVAIVVGLIGIVLPVLPGSLLVLGAILVWAFAEGGSTGGVVGGLAIVLIGASQALKYVVPGRSLRSGGIPNSTLLIGAVLGIIGFFVVPIIGLPIGFVLGVYLAEWRRHTDPSEAWRSTVVALRAVGVSILIELAGALLAAGVWIAGVFAAG